MPASAPVFFAKGHDQVAIGGEAYHVVSALSIVNAVLWLQALQSSSCRPGVSTHEWISPKWIRRLTRQTHRQRFIIAN